MFIICFCQVNVTITSKHYHWLTQQRARNAKANRWTREFDESAKADRNNRDLYPRMPSDMGDNWWDYIRHRLKTMKRGMDVYASDKYTRLFSLDKYIVSNRVCDNVAGMVTNYRSCLVHLGNVEMAPNRPIKIKNHLRAPGPRKMLVSFKKYLNTYVNSVDEYYTSQTCAKCFGRFDRRTRSHRFKVCQNCEPNPDAMLPSMIVSRKSKRQVRLDRLTAHLMGTDDNGHAVQPNDDVTLEGLYSKVS